MSKAENYVVFTADFTYRCPRCGKAGKHTVEHCVHNVCVALVCSGCQESIAFQMKLVDDVNSPVVPLCGATG